MCVLAVFVLCLALGTAAGLADRGIFDLEIEGFQFHECSADQWMCKNEMGKCILADLRCNGQDDCGDDSDEKGCVNFGDGVKAESEYLGCFRTLPRDVPPMLEGFVIKDLDDFSLENRESMTVKTCVTKCRQEGYQYAGVQRGVECRCGNVYGTYGESHTCHIRCVGDKEETCGGEKANSIYSTGME